VPLRHGETPFRQAERLAAAEPSVAESAMNFARLVNRHYYATAPGARVPEQAGSSRAKSGRQEELTRMKRLLGTLRRQIKRAKSSIGQE
jgi:hypothetical protein